MKPNGHTPIDPAHLEDIILNGRDVFVTYTSLKSSISIDDLIEYLRLRKATAEIYIRLNQGGKASVLLTENTKLSETMRDAMRKLLGME